jgi:intein/homing endonuclease
MARKQTEAQYVEEILVPEETDLFELATQGDWFIREGWDRYGEDWENHLPRSPSGHLWINLAAQYLFNFSFQSFQASVYYCPIPDMQLIGARGCGKCLPAGTLVTLSTGRRIPIEGVQPGMKVATLCMNTLKMSAARVLAVTEQPAKPLVRITVKNGAILRCSIDHPLYTVDGWREASMLTAGDRVAVPRLIKRTGITSHWPVERAVILACLIADGGLTTDSARFTNTSTEIVDGLRRALEGWGRFCLVPIKQPDESAPNQYTIKDNTPHAKRNRLISWLRHLGLWGCGSHDKYIPPAVFNQSDEWIAVFLAYLFACDGSAYQSGSPKIEYYTVSERLARDVQALLLTQGIQSRVYSRFTSYREEKRRNWVVTISLAGDRTRFAERIGIPGKQDALSKVLEASEVESNGCDDTVPLHAIRDYVWGRARQVGKPLSKRVNGERPYASLRPQYNTTRAKLERIIEHLGGDAKLERLARSDVYWATITAVEPCGQEPTYDLQVQDTHNFVADGIIVHNSTVVAVANALRAIFNPGHDWLHVAPSIEQAKAMFDIILTQGRQGHFSRLFVQHYRTAPAPDIELRSWNQYDPGTQFHFRSIGGHGGQPMELLRSLEAGIVSADEAFRTFQTDYYVPILVGMSRGPNHYTLNSNPALREEYQDRVAGIQAEPDPLQRKLQEEGLQEFVEKSGAAKQFRLTLSGNAGIWPVWWSRFRWGQRHPGKRWAKRWISSQNLYFTKDQRDFLEQQFEGDPEGLRVEMFAERPLISGGVFSARHVDNLSDESIDQLAIESSQKLIPGWRYIKHPEHGLISYREPAEKGMAYAAGTDPGTGKLPGRNSWVLMWCKLDGPPFKIVGVESGNLTWRGQGSLDPWIATVKEMLALYRFPEGHVAAEATGPQKGVHEVIWPDQLEIVPLNMSSIKPTLIMQAQLMLSRNMFVGPFVDLLHQQLIAYQYNDRKLDQDFVMAFLSLVSVVWPYVEDQFELDDDDSEESDFWEAEEIHREVRDYGREIRVR